MNPKIGDKVTLHSKTFKLDRSNANAMINGFQRNYEETVYKQAIYIISNTRKTLWYDTPKLKYRNDIHLITYNVNEDEGLLRHLNPNTTILLSPTLIPNQNYNFIAVCDTIYKVNERDYSAVCNRICNNTLFDIWNTSGPESVDCWGIGLFRIYKIDKEFTNLDIQTKGIAPSEIKDTVNREITIRNPILSDSEFLKIKVLLEASIPTNTEKRQIYNTLEPVIKLPTSNKLHDLLRFKKQIILQGSPGTGKTFTAKKIAQELTQNGGESKIIQFHPAYSYEDFVRGIVTQTSEHGITYRVENKVVAEFAQKASQDSDNNYVLIIDEINRANLPAVLGELIYALEYRGQDVDCIYELDGSRKISLPENLLIIGTMNTADRSVGNIDYAIRRRFAFVNLNADIEVIRTNSIPEALVLFQTIEDLFSEKNISPDYKKDEIMIGHSYFLAQKVEDLKFKLEYEIKPILREYLKDGVLRDSAELNQVINTLTV